MTPGERVRILLGMVLLLVLGFMAGLVFGQWSAPAPVTYPPAPAATPRILSC